MALQCRSLWIFWTPFCVTLSHDWPDGQAPDDSPDEASHTFGTDHVGNRRWSRWHGSHPIAVGADSPGYYILNILDLDCFTHNLVWFGP